MWWIIYFKEFKRDLVFFSIQFQANFNIVMEFILQQQNTIVPHNTSFRENWKESCISNITFSYSHTTLLSFIEWNLFIFFYFSKTFYRFLSFWSFLFIIYMLLVCKIKISSPDELMITFYFFELFFFIFYFKHVFPLLMSPRLKK